MEVSTDQQSANGLDVAAGGDSATSLTHLTAEVHVRVHEPVAPNSSSHQRRHVGSISTEPIELQDRLPPSHPVADVAITAKAARTKSGKVKGKSAEPHRFTDVMERQAVEALGDIPMSGAPMTLTFNGLRYTAGDKELLHGVRYIRS